MAEARLLRISGNLGLATHGPRRDAALARCPVEVAWCSLARVDAAVFGHAMGLPADLPQARRALTGLEDPELAPELARRSRWLDAGAPQSPGTWLLGIGPVGASGLGFGAAVVFHHPDLGLRGDQLSVQAGATASGNLLASASLNTWGPVGVHAEGAGQQAEVMLYGADGIARSTQWTATSATAAPQLGHRSSGAWLGPSVWRDTAGQTSWTSPGLTGALWHTTSRGVRLSSRATAMGGAHRITHGTLDLRSPAVQTGAALRAVVSPSRAATTTPAWRLPGWGGGQVLRHGAWSQFRSPWLAGAVAEWRQTLAGPLHGVIFGELAWADAAVAGGGGGLRLSLPPRPSATVRLDVGYGTGGMGISAGWGAAF